MTTNTKETLNHQTRRLSIGVIGLGEVGSRLAAGLTRAGCAEVWGYEPRFDIYGPREKERRLSQWDVNIAASPEDLACRTGILIAVVSCEIAGRTAGEYAKYLEPGQIYLDLSSAIPGVKKECAARIRQSGAQFLDGGILSSPQALWEKTPVVISGQGAESVAEALNRCGMNVTSLGQEIGQASGLKILRSIFAKSVEALLLETYTAAAFYGVLDGLEREMIQMFAREPIQPMFERMVATDAVHALRRANEIFSMAQMLEEDGLDSAMSRAAAKKLFWSAESGLYAAMGGHTPEDFRKVVEYLEKYQNHSRRR